MALSVAAAALGAGCGQTTKVDSIEVTAESMDPLPKGITRQYSAIAHYSDNTTQDVSSLVTWRAASDAIISVSNNTGSRGLVTALNFGQSTLTATYNDVIATINVSVANEVLKSILIGPQNPVIANGTTVQLAATGVYSDRSNKDITPLVTWQSADPAIATVAATGSIGLVTGLAQGSAVISASLPGIEGKVTVSVTGATIRQLAVTPATAMLARGTTLQLVATGTFSDNTTQDVTSSASWSSGAAFATVSNQSGSRGLVSGVSNGLAPIQATFNGQSGTANITVTNATLSSITLTPASPAIASGTAVNLVATGNFSDGTTQNLTTSVTWAASVPAVASVSAQGVVSGLGKGQTSISATLGTTVGSTTLTVSAAVLSAIELSPATQSLAAGTNLQLVATGVYSDSTTQDITSLVSWTSSDATLATVSSGAGSRGLARGVAPGPVTITAVLGAVSGTAALTITSATLSALAVTPATQVIASGTN
ncbi:MAG TPA: Ig-like domain-containing protein, partial [Pseudomonadota bacterium]|nr:Ig-like domain-containing protein [Pseudomonadota bacterium]